jgi:proton glutamate symport protein
MKFSRLAPLVLILFVIAALLTALAAYQVVALPEAVPMATRWLAVAAAVALGFQRRSITFWIVVSMLVGAEIGHDFPEQAVQLKVLSDVFLRLVKTIIAPLVFATLVVGIAGHADLKQVGKMGLKALIYFEVVTTFALFIGLGAINLTRAGEGVDRSGIAADTEQLATVKQTTADIITSSSVCHHLRHWPSHGAPEAPGAYAAAHGEPVGGDVQVHQRGDVFRPIWGRWGFGLHRGENGFCSAV